MLMAHEMKHTNPHTFLSFMITRVLDKKDLVTNKYTYMYGTRFKHHMVMMHGKSRKRKETDE